jgi:hypothetical protein
MKKSLYKAVAQRVMGQRPSALRAATGATIAGAATGAVVYKLLRHEDTESAE